MKLCLLTVIAGMFCAAGPAWAQPEAPRPMPSRVVVEPSAATLWRVDRPVGMQPFGDGRPDEQATYGGPEIIPLLGDLTGDGVDDRIVVVDGGGFMNWILDASAPRATGVLGDGVADRHASFGGPPAPNRRPLLGDLNGDGIADRVVFDAGVWYVDISLFGRWGDANIDVQATYGGPEDQRVALGDFNGDGLDDRVLYRRDGAGNGQVLIDLTLAPLKPGDGVPDATLPFGAGADRLPPRLLDFNGDRRADLLIARPTGDAMAWFLSLSPQYPATGGPSGAFGGANVLPLIGHLTPKSQP